MACIIFNVDTFRALYPAFGLKASYTDATLQAYFDQATSFIDDRISCYTGMKVKQQTMALNLMTAHLLAISDMIKKGMLPALPTGSTIDKISVTLEPPKLQSQFQWWLSTTPYGQELLALLQILSVGGLYVGGRNELGAFRRP